jgi:hypothetical protein
MLPKDPCATDCCGADTLLFPETAPVARPGGPPISYVKPMVRMAGMAQDIPDYAVIGWKWVQPIPINYDATTKLLHMGCNFIRVPQLIRSATNHANRLPRKDEAPFYAWHVDTSGPVGILYSSDGNQWHEIGSKAPADVFCV